MRELKLKTPDDIKRIRDAGIIIAELFRTLSTITMELLSTWEIDNFIDENIRKHNARPSFKTVKNYNYASCISINNEVVHGIPSKKKIISRGDLVKIDIGVVKKGYFADGCVTYAVPPVKSSNRELVTVTRECLERALETMYPGNRLGDIGHAVQKHAESSGYSVVRDLSGHGVGFAVHELPTVPHFGRKGTGLILRKGLVLAVEPMINEGGSEIVHKGDGWTIITADGKLSAQFEHTVAVTENGPVVLTA